MPSLRLAIAVATGIAVVTVASGCAASGPDVASAVVTSTAGLPTAVVWSGSTTPFALWAGPQQIYVVTFGSGSCPRLPTKVHADGRHRVTVSTKEHLPKGDDACTSDLGPTTTTVRLPAAIDETAPLRVDIDGATTTLESR